MYFKWNMFCNNNWFERESWNQKMSGKTKLEMLKVEKTELIMTNMFVFKCR